MGSSLLIIFIVVEFHTREKEKKKQYLINKGLYLVTVVALFDGMEQLQTFPHIKPFIESTKKSSSTSCRCSKA